MKMKSAEQSWLLQRSRASLTPFRRFVFELALALLLAIHRITTVSNLSYVSKIVQRVSVAKQLTDYLETISMVQSAH